MFGVESLPPPVDRTLLLLRALCESIQLFFLPTGGTSYRPGGDSSSKVFLT